MVASTAASFNGMIQLFEQIRRPRARLVWH